MMPERDAAADAVCSKSYLKRERLCGGRRAAGAARGEGGAILCSDDLTKTQSKSVALALRSSYAVLEGLVAHKPHSVDGRGIDGFYVPASLEQSPFRVQVRCLIARLCVLVLLVISDFRCRCVFLCISYGTLELMHPLPCENSDFS